MNPTVAQFRSDFPEFSDPATYPDSLITMWLTVASQLVNPERWGALLTIGQELFTAHYVVIAARDQAAAAVTIPGTVRGLQTAKSVGDVSASYDFSSLLNPDAGFWNQTTYGQRFYGFQRLMGAGPIHVIC
jgi:hypothetical protein